MKITILPLNQLKRPERNVRVHPEKQIKELIRSIRMFGQTRPLVCDDSFTVLAGNGLFTALLEMGAAEAECYVIPNLSEKEKKKLMLADNRIYKLGIDDMEAFDQIVSELGEDIDVPGFDEDLLRMLNADLDVADDMFAGYGIVSNDHKTQFGRAAEIYQREEAEFVESSDEYVADDASEPLQPPGAVSSVETPIGHNPEAQAAEAPLESFSPTPLQRRYIICPKCGEKIWL